MSDLSVTDVGRAVARSGLLPTTAARLLEYFRSYLMPLTEFLEKVAIADDDEGEWASLERANEDLAFVFFHMCYSSPEFGEGDIPARRFLPYPLSERRESERARRLQQYLSVQPWDQNVLAVNAADISTDWILGVPLSDLESRYENLRGGMIRDMLRTASSHLSGLADILAAATSSVADDEHSAVFAWSVGDQRTGMLRLIRRLRQNAIQALVGVSDDILWMADVVDSNGDRLIQRRLAMDLRREGIKHLEDMLDRGRTDVLLQVMGRTQETESQISRIRQAAERARLERTERNRARIERRLPDCQTLISRYFDASGKQFEKSLEDCLDCLEIKIIGRDDDERNKPRYPDFVVEYGSGNVIVIECKSSAIGKDIDFKSATDVAGKAAPHALAKNHLVTICQKYVSTDVPRKIETQANLSVVNAEDLGLAMAYLKTNSISIERFMNWLSTPGQPRADELFGT